MFGYAVRPPRNYPFRLVLVFAAFFLQFSPAFLACSAPAQATSVRIEFYDSATGYALRPEVFQARPHSPGHSIRTIRADAIPGNGKLALEFEPGRHQLQAIVPGYSPVGGDFQADDVEGRQLRFLLDPLEQPWELNPESVAARRLENFTLLQGYVSDEDTGQPVADVLVRATAFAGEAATDARGFFQIYVPSPTDGSLGEATLRLSKPGYGALERRRIEVWSGGDWTFRLQLERGNHETVVDEFTLRRRAPVAIPQTSTVVSTNLPAPELFSAVDAATDLSGPQSTLPANATVRIPRNIRVVRADGTNIDYVTLTYYTRCVLPSEWIPSWGNYTGGSNSLNAGAVAARCYAINRINTASATSSSDICATTSCQVYDPTRINSLTDSAVNFTANWVLINSVGAIPSTEYSAENNALNAGVPIAPCGDTFTGTNFAAPLCIYDPACAGEARFGHGRGMCQWGSARWATGRRMAGRSSGDATPTGFARRDWAWIVRHYYPALTLVKAAPLVIGDDVKALRSLDVRSCPGGTITNGTVCGLVTTRATGNTGVIVGGPLVVTNDGRGFTWYQVRWNDAATNTGWSVENYLERVFAVSTAPTSLVATAVAASQINLAWVDSSEVEAGFEIERAPSANGPWLQITSLGANITTYSDRQLLPGSTWFYRVNSFNAGGPSAYSGLANATTTMPAPVPGAIPDYTIPEHTTLEFTHAATATDRLQLLTDFEPFVSETANGVVLFRAPRFSGSTSALLETYPDLAAVTDNYPTNGHGTGLVLQVSFAIPTNAVNPWLRLTTASAPTLPNPVIDFHAKLRFDVYCDRPGAIAVGCRETATAPGTTLGADGGASGGIEWIGVTNRNGTAPVPSRALAAATWTTMTFDLARESATSFSGGNSVLSTASGLGVLEHVAFVPAGAGRHDLYLDNLMVARQRTLTFSLGPGTPAGVQLNASSGVFSWTPTEDQGPSTNVLSIIVSDDSVPPLRATNSFVVVVTESNRPPTLAPIENCIIHAGSSLVITNTASDPDVPPPQLSYSLEEGPPEAAVDPGTGRFTWTSSDATAGTLQPVALRVTDNGNPPLFQVRTFSIAVLPRPTLQSEVVAGQVRLSWPAIAGQRYRLQSKSDLAAAIWSDVVPDIVAPGLQVSVTNAATGQQMFYRLQVLD